MVFAEAVPAARRLADPNTPPEERERLKHDAEASIAAARDTAERDTQRARHEANHARRDQVMADYVPGKRGEPKRLARLHNVPTRTVETWIRQMKVRVPVIDDAAWNDWRAVYIGEGIRHRNRLAGRRRGQSKT
jgi:hypothetical protein